MFAPPHKGSLLTREKKKHYHTISKVFGSGRHHLTVRVQRNLIHFYINLHELGGKIWSMIASFTPNH